MIYEIADLRVQLNNRCRYTERFCEKYLSDDQTSPVDVSATVTDEEFYAEKAASPQFSDGYIENICLYRKLCVQLPSRNRFLLHAAVIEYNGNAYAFLGRSGTGKSTHSSLWIKNIPNVSVLNGDKPILNVADGQVYAYGTPWMGKEGLGRKGRAPLKGLCFLEQAKENEIVRLSPKEGADRLFLQLLFPTDEENATKTLELADELVKRVPAYLLKCDISEQALKCSFEMMTGEKYSPCEEGEGNEN